MMKIVIIAFSMDWNMWLKIVLIRYLLTDCMRAVTLLKTFLLKSKSSRKVFRNVIISLSGFRNKKHAE